MNRNSDDDDNYDKRREDRFRVGDHVILYRRGKRGTWTAEFHHTDKNGRRQHGRRSLRTRNRRAAEQKARDLERTLADGEFTPQPEADKPERIDATIKQFIDSKRTDGRAPKTLAKYEGELLNFAAYLKDKHGVETLRGIGIGLARANSCSFLAAFSGPRRLIVQ